MQSMKTEIVSKQHKVTNGINERVVSIIIYKKKTRKLNKPM